MSFLTDLERRIILTLKGRISKALAFNSSTSLKDEEKIGLEAIFQEIDDILLYKGLSFKNVKENFQNRLKETASVLKKSRKAYLRSHIIPLMNKIGTGNWDGDNLDD